MQLIRVYFNIANVLLSMVAVPSAGGSTVTLYNNSVHDTFTHNPPRPFLGNLSFALAWNRNTDWFRTRDHVNISITCNSEQFHVSLYSSHPNVSHTIATLWSVSFNGLQCFCDQFIKSLPCSSDAPASVRTVEHTIRPGMALCHTSTSMVVKYVYSRYVGLCLT